MLDYFIFLIVVHWIHALLRLLFSEVKTTWLAGSWLGNQGLNTNMDVDGTMEQQVINRRQRKGMMKYFHFARGGVQTTTTTTTTTKE